MPKAMLISMHGDPLARLGGVQSGGQNVYARQVALGLQRLGWEVATGRTPLLSAKNNLAPGAELSA